jgi:hypothetical protein
MASLECVALAAAAAAGVTGEAATGSLSCLEQRENLHLIQVTCLSNLAVLSGVSSTCVTRVLAFV